MNLYHYINSTLLDAISKKFPEIDLSCIRINYQVSPVNKTFISTAVPRVIMSSLSNNQSSTSIAHKLVSCINPDQEFIDPDIFISNGFINFQASMMYVHRLLHTQPVYEISFLRNIISDNTFYEKLKRLLDHADTNYPQDIQFNYREYPILSHTEYAIITLIVFAEFTNRENAQSYITKTLISLLKKYYLEVPVFTKNNDVRAIRIRLIKQACTTLFQQKK